MKFFYSKQILCSVCAALLLPGSALATSAESDDSANLLRQLQSGSRIDAFANSAFLYADTTCLPVEVAEKFIARILAHPASVTTAPDRFAVWKMKNGSLTFPEDTSKERREFIVAKAKNTGLEVSDIINAEGAVILRGRTLFWKLLSDKTLLIITPVGDIFVVQS
jgi:hypothetical protein